MVSSSSYDGQPVQPRRPGPPPAGLDLQDLRADHGDQAGDRSLLDLLHVETARPRPAQVGPLGGAHRRRGLPGDGQPAAGDGRLRQHRLRPARPRRRPAARRRDGELAGDRRARSTASRPRGSAACASASRRWRWRAPTRPSPPAASTASRSRSSRVVFPGGHVERPEPRAAAAGRLRSGRLRGDPPAARQHHRRHRHRRLHRLRRAGRQDRHHRRIHRRLVRRLPAQPGDRGLGRLPGVERRSR